MKCVMNQENRADHDNDYYNTGNRVQERIEHVIIGNTHKTQHIIIKDISVVFSCAVGINAGGMWFFQFDKQRIVVRSALFICL